MSDDKKITQLPGTQPQPKQQLPSAEPLLAFLPEAITFYEVHAKLLKIRYDALRGQGFTPEQALALCSSLF